MYIRTYGYTCRLSVLQKLFATPKAKEQVRVWSHICFGNDVQFLLYEFSYQYVNKCTYMYLCNTMEGIEHIRALKIVKYSEMPLCGRVIYM